ncbi:glyoxalase superfamily protein [Sphingobacterium endophyticum]|uniref:glyoxalase superfamily protein n=1 Tax=Sphingobacterium endophyticum TaxID=2546448 RepID=UPI0012E1796D|nr:glyoxalase superfamily protein [Sphingobacterium endophyticum]
MKVEQVIPIFRIFDYSKAVEFYIDWLGFQIDWEHTFEENTPIYMQISRNGCTLHLSEHHGDATPGAQTFVYCSGLKDYHHQLIQKNYKHNKPGYEETFYNTHCVQVIDPFGNRISFNEPLQEAK